MSVAVKCFRPYDKKALRTIMECAGCPPPPDPQCPPMCCIPPPPVTRCCPPQQGSTMCCNNSRPVAPSSACEQTPCPGAVRQPKNACCPPSPIINQGGFFYAAKKC